MAVLWQFFSETSLGELAADSLLKHQIKAIIPNFTFIDQAYAQDMAAIDETKFRLSKAANESIKRGVNFRSMAEYMSHHKTQTGDNFDEDIFGIPYSYTSMLIAGCTTLSIIALIFSIVIGVWRKTTRTVVGVTEHTLLHRNSNSTYSPHS